MLGLEKKYLTGDFTPFGDKESTVPHDETEVDEENDGCGKLNNKLCGDYECLIRV